jgi:hypothetical protein
MIKINFSTICLLGAGYLFFIAKPTQASNAIADASIKAAKSVLQEAKNQVKKQLE